MLEVVTPAEAGVQDESRWRYWIPAFAGMTAISNFTWLNQYAWQLHVNGGVIRLKSGDVLKR